MLVGTFAIFATSLTLLNKLPVEYMPREDRAFAMVMVTAPDGASLDYTLNYVQQVEDMLAVDREKGDVFKVMSRSGSWGAGADVNRGMLMAPLSEWSERERSANEIVRSWNRQLRELPASRRLRSRRGVGPSGRAVGRCKSSSVAPTTRSSPAGEISLLQRRAKSPGCRTCSQTTTRRNRKSMFLSIGIAPRISASSLSTVGRTLESMLGSRVVTTFVERGEEYRVILQGADERRQTPSDLDTIYVRSERSGQLIPLSNLVQLNEVAGAVDLRRFDRLRAITISASLGEGYSLGQAVADMENIIRTELPEAAQIKYNGETRDLKRTGNSIYWTFLLALVIAYLVLAAQFESFKHPFIIMTTVPLAIAGALLGLYFFDSTINVYSQIGAIMLIGACREKRYLDCRVRQSASRPRRGIQGSHHRVGGNPAASGANDKHVYGVRGHSLGVGERRGAPCPDSRSARSSSSASL